MVDHIKISYTHAPLVISTSDWPHNRQYGENSYLFVCGGGEVIGSIFKTSLIILHSVCDQSDSLQNG